MYGLDHQYQIFSSAECPKIKGEEGDLQLTCFESVLRSLETSLELNSTLSYKLTEDDHAVEIKTVNCGFQPEMLLAKQIIKLDYCQLSIDLPPHFEKDSLMLGAVN